MEKESKFFNALDYYKFIELSIEKQQQLLIDKAVYCSLNVKPDIIFDKEKILVEYGGNEIEFLCEQITVNDITYELNEEFLQEVYQVTRSHFSSYQILLNRSTKKLSSVLDIFLTSKDKNDFLKEEYDRAAKQYIEHLSEDLFSLLHVVRDKNPKELLNILRDYLQYCRKDLSHYLFGLNNFSSFHINTAYFSHCHFNNIFDFCKAHMDFDPQNGKRKTPQSIAMVIQILFQIGFFELPIIKNSSTDDSRYKIIAMLIRYDYVSTNLIREIRGNVDSLNTIKSVNRDRFKASSHSEIIREMLNEVK